MHAGLAQERGHIADHLVAGLVAPGVVEALEMVDVENAHGQHLARRLRRLEGPGQLIVEGLAVGEIGQGVGHGVPAHLLQVRAQALDLLGGIGQPGLQGGVFLLDAAGGDGQALDHPAQLLRLGGLGQLPGRAFQGTAVFVGADLGHADGRRDRRQLPGQLVPGVADLLRQAQAGQMLHRQVLGNGVGQGLSGVHQAIDFPADGAFGIADGIEPQLEVQGRGPHLTLFHLSNGQSGNPKGVTAPDERIDVVGHGTFSRERRWGVLALVRDKLGANAKRLVKDVRLKVDEMLDSAQSARRRQVGASQTGGPAAVGRWNRDASRSARAEMAPSHWPSRSATITLTSG